MKDRIRLIMDSENMNPARFADTLQIGRAVISHILNGRNNPSLEVITKILNKMPQISSEWLLTGVGSMYKNSKNEKITNPSQIPDLFTDHYPHENEINQGDTQEQTKYDEENEIKSLQNDHKSSIKEIINANSVIQKKIKQIIIYYTDNTFETFNSH